MDATEAKILYTILIALGLLLIFIVTFLLTVVRHQRKISELQAEKIKVEIKALEKDRTRIAGDLHDELGPLLSSVRMQLSNARAKTAEDQQLIDESGQRIGTAVQKIREIARDLMPAVLQRRGLRAALEDFLEERAELSGTAITKKINLHSDLPGNEVSVHVYRIVQEAVHNTEKHAKATMMSLELYSDEDNIRLQIKDNGIGFDQEAQLKMLKGIGLRSISNRVDLLGGSLYLDTKSGTCYVIEIPISRQGSSSSETSP